jgi:hypothetical protein
MEDHPICKFKELEAAFYKHYQNVQIDKQMYMALWVIKQGGDEKVEVYYETYTKTSKLLSLSNR